jgi:hypothetical protein
VAWKEARDLPPQVLMWIFFHHTYRKRRAARKNWEVVLAQADPLKEKRPLLLS